MQTEFGERLKSKMKIDRSEIHLKLKWIKCDINGSVQNAKYFTDSMKKSFKINVANCTHRVKTENIR